jgi:flavorubredoxin
MRKIIKIIIGIFLMLIIVGFVTVGIVITDVAGNTATDTHPLPNGAATGKALVIYDPGLSGGAKDAATKIGYKLQSAGYDVLLAGVKSKAASNIAEYNVVVVGGPIYAGKPASTIQSYLNSFNPPTNIKVGVFGYGSIQEDNRNQTKITQEVAPLPSNSSVQLNAIVKISSNDNINGLCQQFVSELLQ